MVQNRDIDKLQWKTIRKIMCGVSNGMTANDLKS